MLQLGIVGLPNVGKTSLFNALTSADADAASHPFSTVKPNVGIVEVPDARLATLTAIVRPKKTVNATVQFVDIAGLAQGASRGEGLGNQFLSYVRDCDAIVHVVRCFDDPDLPHVLDGIDPARDREVIEFELALADLASVDKRLDKTRRAARVGEKEAQAEVAALEKAHAPLAEGKALRHVSLGAAERALLAPLQLLTLKPVLYAANVADTDLQDDGGAHTRALRGAIARDGESALVVAFSARIEGELAQLAPEERVEFLHSLGLESAGLDRLIRAGFHLLGLETFFTAGEKEVRAWTFHRGDTAPAAAGVIHSDFERGFIRAETVSYDDFVAHDGWKGAREKGVVRSEGREYVVRDGDVMLFRFNV